MEEVIDMQNIIDILDVFEGPWIGFPNLGIDFLKKFTVNPVLIPNIFGTTLSVHWYGVIIALAIIAALTLAMRQSKKFGIKDDDIIDMFIIALPISVICARLYYVIFSWSFYKNNLLSIFKIWEGGLSIYGAIIGGIISVYIFSRWRKIDMLDFCDFACVYLPLAQAIGRWGNFVNQEMYGKVTKLPWGMTGSTIGNDPVHPTFLYESLLNIILFIILLRIRRNRKVKGSVLASYLMGYGLIRFLLEFLRADEFGTGNIRYNQVFSAVVFIGALIWLMYLVKRSQMAETVEEEAEPSAYAEVLEKLKAEEAASGATDEISETGNADTAATGSDYTGSADSGSDETAAHGADDAETAGSENIAETAPDNNEPTGEADEK